MMYADETVIFVDSKQVVGKTDFFFKVRKESFLKPRNEQIRETYVNKYELKKERLSK